MTLTAPRLTALQARALICAYWHRLISTDQLRRLLRPQVTPRHMQQQLADLRERGLLACVRRGDKQLLWFTTDAGAAMVEATGEVDLRPYRMTAEKAVAALQQHTYDVVETGIAFVTAARAHHHDCGPLSWAPEVAHRYAGRASTPGHRDVLIVDAVLRYTVEETGIRSQHTFFIEVDRASMPVARLATKLRAYLRYHSHVPRHPGSDGRPAWQQRYPRFPRILVVLSGEAEHVLDRRLADLRGHAGALPALRVAGEHLTVLATTLERLRTHGPASDIAVPVLADDHTPQPLVRAGRVSRP